MEGSNISLLPLPLLDGHTEFRIRSSAAKVALIFTLNNDSDKHYERRLTSRRMHAKKCVTGRRLITIHGCWQGFKYLGCTEVLEMNASLWWHFKSDISSDLHDNNAWHYNEGWGWQLERQTCQYQVHMKCWFFTASFRPQGCTTQPRQPRRTRQQFKRLHCRCTQNMCAQTKVGLKSQEESDDDDDDDDLGGLLLNEFWFGTTFSPRNRVEVGELSAWFQWYTPLLSFHFFTFFAVIFIIKSMTFPSAKTCVKNRFSAFCNAPSNFRIANVQKKEARKAWVHWGERWETHMCNGATYLNRRTCPLGILNTSHVRPYQTKHTVCT